jgi:hypothetical protein
VVKSHRAGKASNAGIEHRRTRRNEAQDQEPLEPGHQLILGQKRMNSDDEDQGDHGGFGYRAGEQEMQEFQEQEADPFWLRPPVVTEVLERSQRYTGQLGWCTRRRMREGTR